MSYAVTTKNKSVIVLVYLFTDLLLIFTV